MSEGTKLGELDGQEFNAAIRDEAADEPGTELKATRIGEKSEFELGLGEDAASEAPVDENPAPEIEQDIKDDAPVQKMEATPIEPARPDADEDNLFAQELEKSVVDYQEGDIIKGVVRRVEKSGVLVDISYKSDGFIANSEFSFDPSEIPSKVVNPGDEVNVFIVKLESKEGYTVLSRKRAEYEVAWNELSRMSKSRDTIDVRVNSKVQGGLVASYKGIKGFIPASQVLRDGDDLDHYIGNELPVTVLQADRKRRKVIFSNKMARQRVPKEDVSKILEGIEVGEVLEGRVTSIKDFGVFVDVGGIEGLVHISELSWSRVNHPSELLKVGDEVKVFVLGVDRDSSKVSLGMKQLEPDPWVDVADRYEVGQTVTGKITRVVPFGAFIQIEDNLEGLIHISELSYDHVEKVEDVVAIGQDVEARIIKLIPDEQRIGLSLKGVGEHHSEDSQVIADESSSNDEQVQQEASQAEVASDDSEAVESALEHPEAIQEAEDQPQANAVQSEQADDQPESASNESEDSAQPVSH